MVQWIAGWVDASAQPWFETNIPFNRFEDMVADTRACLDRVLRFYDVDPADFVYPDPPYGPGDRNFRRGEIDEWRRVLTGDQIERASAMIPAALYDRFGWPRG
jgi:hypothetical protein